MVGKMRDISCDKHGRRIQAMVCRHHVSDKGPLGFVENSADPADLQAWCAACEELFQATGEMTEEFRLFNDVVVVCDLCYIMLKARHALSDLSA